MSFGKVNRIAGGRDQGKTALCEAIVWAVKGCDLKGHTKGIRKHLQSWNTTYTRVLTTWDVEGSDQPFSLCREIKGKSMRIYLNELEVHQDEVDILWGNTDTFLSIFVPGYFSSLTPIRKHGVLLSMMPKIDIVEALAGLSEEDQARLDGMKDPVEYLKQCQEELQEWNEYTGDIKTRIQKIQFASNLSGGSDVDTEITQQLYEKIAKFEELSAEDDPIPPDVLKEWEAELALLGERYRKTHDEWKVAYEWQPTDLAGQGQRALQIQAKKAACLSLLEEGKIIREDITRMRELYDEEVQESRQRKTQEMHLLQLDIQRLEARRTIVSKNSMNSEKLAHLQKKLSEGETEHRAVKHQLEAVQQLLLRYAELQVEKANKIMSGSEMKLLQRTLKGEIQLIHKLLYQDREFGLTRAELAEVSMDLSRLENNVNGSSIPVFIEHGDLLRPSNEPGQIFLVSEVPDAKLSYEIIVA